MRNFLKIMKKYFVFLLCIVLLIFHNRWLVLSDFGVAIDHYGRVAYPWILNVVALIGIILFTYDILIIVSTKSAKNAWNNVQNELMLGVEHTVRTQMSDGNNSLYYDCQCVLLADDRNMTGEVLLKKLCKQFEKEDILQKERISYLFLAHRSNRSVAEFGSTPDGESFFKKCMKCSNEVLHRRTYVDDRVGFSSEVFNSVINEFLHFSLLSNMINTNEKIDYIRRVLSWIRSELSEKSAVEDMNLQMFMMALAKLEKNLFYHNVNDKIINTYIRSIKKSWCFRRMYWNANYRLWTNTSNETCKERMSDSGFIVAHIWKFGIFYRTVLRFFVSRSLKNYRLKYHKSYKNAIAILVMAAPLGNVLPNEQDYTDKILTVVKAIGGKE